MSANSPPPPSMPPPAGLKRARPTASTLSQAANPNVGTGLGGATGPGSRAKRRKPEPVADDKKEKEEEGDIKTKIDFNDLPVEALYRYLESHDLLPRWEPNPWSEEPCVPPNQLFSNPPLPASASLAPATNGFEYPATTPTLYGGAQFAGSTPPLPASVHEEEARTEGAVENGHIDVPAEPGASAPAEEPQGDAIHPSERVNESPAPANGDVSMSELPPDELSAGSPQGRSPSPLYIEPPTTRSKTAPARRPPTPQPPSPPPPPKRGVVTLSDVAAAKHVLAEKANAHWAKGLGGGQNKEGETIVNFLYKMKVGPGRLLRVYNPSTTAQPPWM